MIKKIIKSAVSSLGYEIRKKYDSGHQNDAVVYNGLELVNKRNSDLNHFQKMMKGDTVFITKLFPRIKQYLPNVNFKYLDVGCGTGVLVNLLTEEYPESIIYGCDFSEVKIKQCVEFYKRKKYFVHNILDPIEKKYDIISCTEVLEHLEEPEQALFNLLNALLEQGILIITVPNGREDRFEGHINFWSPESFKIFINKKLAEFKINFDTEFIIINGKNVVIIKNV